MESRSPRRLPAMGPLAAAVLPLDFSCSISESRSAMRALANVTTGKVKDIMLCLSRKRRMGFLRSKRSRRGSWPTCKT